MQPKPSRRQFLNELKRDLPQALKLLEQGNIAPVDLAQASILSGLGLSTPNTPLSSNLTALPWCSALPLQLINQILDEFLTEQEGEFDSDTRWALTWFEQYQFNEALYGDAETLSKAKNTSIQGMVEARHTERQKPVKCDYSSAKYLKPIGSQKKMSGYPSGNHPTPHSIPSIKTAKPEPQNSWLN
ncbi:MAG UNVERIFIED_CONTAM: hypothetical protein LVR29_19735 [Microcystis novacekii LVE1205-3]|jgi:adenine-specific DNA methylase